MPLSPFSRVPFVLVASVAISFAPTLARAADPQCAPAYENAQLLRQRGKLESARAAALVCARPSCPEVARKDCSAWLEQMQREIPSVTVIARDVTTGEDATTARVLVDGIVRPEASAGRALELDPGLHVFRVESSGAEPVEQSVTVFQGERDRILRFALKRTGSPSAASTAAQPVAPQPIAIVHTMPPSPGSATPASADDGRGRTYLPAVLVGSASALSLGASAWIGLTARHDLTGLRTSCAPACGDGDVDPLRRRLLISDVTLGVGIIGAAVAVYLFARPPESSSGGTATRVDVSPTRGGGAFAVRGTF